MTNYEAEVQRAITTIQCGTHTSKNELEEAVEVLLLDHERLTREVERLRGLTSSGTPSAAYAFLVSSSPLRGEGEKP